MTSCRPTLSAFILSRLSLLRALGSEASRGVLAWLSIASASPRSAAISLSVRRGEPLGLGWRALRAVESRRALIDSAALAIRRVAARRAAARRAACSWKMCITAVVSAPCTGSAAGAALSSSAALPPGSTAVPTRDQVSSSPFEVALRSSGGKPWSAEAQEMDEKVCSAGMEEAKASYSSVVTPEKCERRQWMVQRAR